MSGPRKVPRMENEESNLTLKLLPEFGEVQKDEAKEMCVMASITSRAIESDDEKRNPLELVVVLDKSGSMSGTKLNLCIQSLEFLIEELGAKDKLGLVLFDSNVEISFPLTTMDSDGKELTLKKVKQVTAGSMTNLSGGLLQGLDFLVTSSKENKDEQQRRPCSRSIILLTDGLMNEGITDKAALTRIVENSLKQVVNGASIHVFGYGTDADVNTGTAIAEIAKGMFYSVTEIDQVATSFAGALGGLLSVAAQNINMTFTLATGCEFASDPLTKFKVLKDEKKGNNAYTVMIPDLYSEETRDVLFTVKLPKVTATSKSKVGDENEMDGGDQVTSVTKIGTCVVKFLDVQYEKLNEISETVVIARVDKVVETTVNPQVQTQRLRIQVANDLEQAKKQADSGDLAGARTFLAKRQDALTSEGVSELDEGIRGELANDLKTSYSLMERQSVYEKKGKSLMSSKVMGHQFQRSVQTSYQKEDYMMDMASGSASAPMTGINRPSAYTNAFQQKLMKKAAPRSPSPNRQNSSMVAAASTTTTTAGASTTTTTAAASPNQQPAPVAGESGLFGRLQKFVSFPTSLAAPTAAAAKTKQ